MGSKRIILMTLISLFLLSTKIFAQSTITKQPIKHSKSIKVVGEEHKYFHSTYTLQLPNKPQQVNLEVFTIDKDNVNIIIADLSQTRFKMPEEEPFPYQRTKGPGSLIHPNFKVQVQEDPFSLSVIKNEGEIVFQLDTEHFDFSFEETLLDFTVLLPSKYLYGLGERIMDFKFKPGIYTIYNKDQYDTEEDGSGGKNIYGSHPMYLVRDKSGAFHVNYLRNTSPMDVIVKDHHDDCYSLNFKVLGGIIDFHFFLGDSNPDTALKQYHSLLGGFALPPFWAMGWHQSRWGYTSQEMVKEVLEGYKSHKLPMDVFWLDIDYMDEYIAFTVDPLRYNSSEINAMIEEHRKKLVVIVEPNMGIKKDPFNFTKEGEEKGLFVRNQKGGFLYNKVWPGKCYFVDYFHPGTKEYWHMMLREFQKTLNFSGVWLDMNEVAALTDGEALFDENGNELAHPDPCEDNTGYTYLPGNTKLEKFTICPNAKHYNNVTHVNVHNYYPNQQARLTNEYLSEVNKMEFPFILSRANAPGMGKFAAHWTGDNQSTFKYMRTSISQIFNFNIFGIPMTGADVCGYGGVNPTEELCAKWMQLGTLYPFARQHSHISNSRKEPWQFSDTMLETSRKALEFRYKILKYYYSLFIKSQNKGTIFKPVFFEFPEKELLDNDFVYNTQFMIGSDLLVVPNVEEGKFWIEGYFPGGSWYDLRSNERVSAGKRNISAELNQTAPIFLREGKTIFLQDASTIENSLDLKNDIELIVALSEDSENQISEGIIPALNNYLDRNQVENCLSKDCFIKFQTTYTKETNELRFKFNKPWFTESDYSGLKLTKIKVYGLEGVTQFNNNFTSKLKQNSRFFVEKIKAKTLNDNSIEFSFREPVEIKEEVDIMIKFI